MPKTIKKQTYKNAISYKGHNKRVTIFKEEDGFELEFRLVDGDITIPRAETFLVKNKMVVTKLRITKEAAGMLLDGLLDFNKQIIKQK